MATRPAIKQGPKYNIHVAFMYAEISSMKPREESFLLVIVRVSKRERRGTAIGWRGSRLLAH